MKKAKKTTAILLAVLMMFGMIAAAPITASAESVSISEGETKAINAVPDEENNITFTPTGSGQYVFTSEGEEGDPYAYLYLNDEELAFDDDSGDGHNFRLIYELEENVTYTLKIYDYNDESIVISIRVDSYEYNDDDNDDGDGDDNNDDGNNDTRLKYGDYYYSILDDGTIDFYGLDLHCEDFSIAEFEVPDEIDGYKVSKISGILPGQLAYRYDNLTKVVIPKSVKEVDTESFTIIFNLKEIVVDEDNSFYSSSDGVLYNKKKTKLIYYPERKEETQYNIPDSVEIIENGAFGAYQSSLITINISKNLADFDGLIFSICEKLERMALSRKVCKIF